MVICYLGQGQGCDTSEKKKDSIGFKNDDLFNGPIVSAENANEIDVILDLAFQHWCQIRTRM